MTAFERFAHEMHRRSLWQVLGIYCLGSWFAYEVILGLREGVGLPEWVAPMAVALFLIGLPVVMATAFVQEGGPGSAGEAPAASASPTGGDPGAAGAEPQPEHRGPVALGLARHLTWRRAVGGGLLAFSALGLATGAFLGMRSMGVGPVGTLVAKGVLEKRDPILLADFENTTTDATLGRVITDALRIDLLESPTVRVVDAADVREVVLRMGRSTDEPIHGEVAREVALRGGWKATIEGDVAPVGAGYLLAARVVTADGQVLAGFREQARGEDELLSAIDRLSKAIRAKVGESLRSVQGGMALEAVSTSSLEALRLYSHAVRVENTDPMRAIQLYEEAVAQDSTFAMAYRKLAVVLGNTRMGFSRHVEAVSRAYALRDRLNERERGHATAFYHIALSGDYGAAIGAYRTILDRWPDDDIALNNLALAYLVVRQPGEAEAVLERIEGPLTLTNLNNLVDARFAQEDTAGAWAAVERAGQVALGDLTAEEGFGLMLLAASGELVETEALVDSLRTKTRDVVALTRLESLGAAVALARGRLARSEDLVGSVLERFRRTGRDPQRLEFEVGSAQAFLEVTRDSARALRAVRDALARIPLADLDPYDRPYLPLASVLAQLGQVEEAARLLDEYEAAIPKEHRGAGRDRLRAVRGLVALGQGRHEEAVRLLEEATSSMNCTICFLPALGRAYAAAERLDDAVAAHERFLETPSFERFPEPGYQLPRVLEDLGRLYEARGDRARAAATYARLVDLWADADAPLIPRREAARARLQALTAEI